MSFLKQFTPSTGEHKRYAKSIKLMKTNRPGLHQRNTDLVQEHTLLVRTQEFNFKGPVDVNQDNQYINKLGHYVPRRTHIAAQTVNTIELRKNRNELTQRNRYTEQQMQA
ncbi:unnamed protein product [Macrosiphum euphorbiae]|uniref:Uncharacterized protein n=1 Tax=Macrosiphum euphorbiae TaxID=13131 RepID=A0AAV0WQD7_9HEMI|nr:unnamed protein product [Macrosiphum euphorbiae]